MMFGDQQVDDVNEILVNIFADIHNAQGNVSITYSFLFVNGYNTVKGILVAFSCL